MTVCLGDIIASLMNIPICQTHRLVALNAVHDTKTPGGKEESCTLQIFAGHVSGFHPIRLIASTSGSGVYGRLCQRTVPFQGNSNSQEENIEQQLGPNV